MEWRKSKAVHDNIVKDCEETQHSTYKDKSKNIGESNWQKLAIDNLAPDESHPYVVQNKMANKPGA